MNTVDLRKINLEKADLHLHTRFSDGDYEPEDVVKRRAEEGFEYIAITDHDGIEGSRLCFNQNFEEKYGIKIIPGIEFDSEDKLGKKLHILGYNIDFNAEKMTETLTKVISWRRERNDCLLKALQNYGFDITQEEVDAVNQGRYIGKPTFAKVLVNKGLVADNQFVFDNIYTRPEFKKIAKNVLSTEEVIKVIHASGGIAVFAHPMEQLRVGEEASFEAFKPRLIKLLETMLDYGIDGIECYHPSATEQHSKYLEVFADAHGLIKTKGSDFHGDGKRDFGRYHVG